MGYFGIQFPGTLDVDYVDHASWLCIARETFDNHSPALKIIIIYERLTLVDDEGAADSWFVDAYRYNESAKVYRLPPERPWDDTR